MLKNLAKISPEGFPMIILSVALGWLLALFGFYTFSILFLILTICLLFFFRDPDRNITTDPDAVISPADGKVMIINEEKETEFLNKNCVKISIFLSVLDCHVNRFPVSGKVLATKYQPGKYNLAYDTEASNENEKLTTFVQLDSGVKLLFSQVAGFLARRIVSNADVGDYFTQGERFGIIKFGSRMDLYLPEKSVLEINVGDKVKAGETILAWLIEKN
jgi:phosphatidylserine decarboxylase